MQYERPRALDEAIALGAEFDFEAKYVAGGTAVVLMLQQGLIDPTVLIDLGHLEDVPGITAIEQRDDLIRVGAGVSLTEVARAPVIREWLPDLARAAALVGNVRVRNAATLCGNAAEADHSSDPPAVLVNRGAEVVVVGPNGERREPVESFLVDFLTTTLAPGEIVVALEVPVTEDSTARYTKFRSRSTEDRPCVSVASLAVVGPQRTIDSLHVTVGATTPRPVRLDEVTTALVGRVLDRTTAAEVASSYRAHIEPVSDSRGSAWYRSEVIEVEVRRSLEALAESHGGRS
jgi:aerobic carbon-monoxide dehydrogenase medium subunit